MDKRTIYVVLSGLITAGAVAGWYHDTTPAGITIESAAEPQVTGKTDTQQDSRPTQKTAKNVADSAIADGLGQIGAELQKKAETASAHESVRAMLDNSAKGPAIRLLTPESAPDIAAAPGGSIEPDNTQAALDAIRSIASESDAAIIVDLSGNRMLAGDENAARRLLEKLGTSAKDAGVVMFDADGVPTIAAYQCLDSSRKVCVSFERAAKLSVSSKCDAVQQHAIKCGEDNINIQALVDGTGCDAAPADALRDAMSAASEQGNVEAGGKSYRYQKQTLPTGCALVTLVPNDADAPQTEPKQSDAAPEKAQIVAAKGAATPSKAGKPRWGGKHLLTAGASGILMVLLGFFCTRRPQNSAPQQLPVNYIEPDRIREKDEEIIALKTQIAELESAADTASTQYRSLSQELSSAQLALKQEELRSLSLEQEKTKLEDALATAKSQDTEVENLRRFGIDSQNPAFFAQDKIDQIEELNEEATVVQPAPLLPPKSAEKTKAPDTASLPQSVFDALSDDGWDEIADSFDSIMAGTSKPMGGLEDESDSDGLYKTTLSGVSSLLGGLDSSDKRASTPDASEPGHIKTETKLKPVGEAPKLAELPSIFPSKNKGPLNTIASSKPIPSLSDFKSSVTDYKPLPRTGTLAGLEPKPTQKTIERPVVESASELAMKADDHDKNGDSFRPAPSWTGKKVVDRGMDANSLAEALKRRARDVSEVSMPAATTSKSVNHSLSKSGVFSVTGSRVDINPLSDNEYFKSLYDKFIETQKSCGEPTNKFTLEQFVSKLAREKAHLMKTYKCKNVRFQVYVKDGKTSLKAMPQK